MKLKTKEFNSHEDLTEFVNYTSCLVVSIVYNKEFILFYRDSIEMY